MKRKKVFVDSDVIISSLISSTGAAYYLLHDTDLELIVSNKSVEELEKVVDRLNLDSQKLRSLLKKNFKTIKLGKTQREHFGSYTLDPDDAHIIAGSKKAKARFLISYNIRHFRTDKIAGELKTVVMTPAKFLQYLRSIQ